MGNGSYTRREFLKLAGVGAALAGTGVLAHRSEAFGAEKRPNIVLILADDLGYGELSCQGNAQIPTPNIDSIATNGVRFTNGYVSCPVCSPTRAGLMTGRYQQRFGYEFNPGNAVEAAPNFGLPLTEKTFADLLKAQDYATGLVGKWHLGYKPQFHPQKRGFGEFFGFIAGAHSYVDAMGDPTNLILRGTEPVDEKEYLTDAFAREAVAFIEKHKAHPFFLYLSFNAMHAPLQDPPKLAGEFSQISDPKRRTFARMERSMDDAVGDVLAKLRAAGLEENTLVIFLSDNGGPTPSTTSKNDPLSGVKGQTLEGGIRVPFMLQWKGKIMAQKQSHEPVIALDILPTALAAAGAKIPGNLEGVNLLPSLTTRSSLARNEGLFWRYGNQSAVRLGNWKLVKREGKERLYDLSSDIGETKDLSAENPERLKLLREAYKAWDVKNADPLWGPKGAPAPRLKGKQ